MQCLPTSPEEAARYFSSRMDIDLDLLEYNFRYIQEKVRPASVVAVIKANAMGHGARYVGRALQGMGATLLGVSNFFEGVHLRDNGVTTGILVFNGLTPAQVEMAIALDLSFFGIDPDFLSMVNDTARSLRKKARVHLKVDTGMGRKGFLPDQAHEIASVVPRLDHVQVDGVASHLASPYLEEHDEFSRAQYQKFMTAASIVDPHHKAIWHFAASSGAIRFPSTYADAVRPGALIYGTGRVWPIPWPLKPVSSFSSILAQVKVLPKGHNVGYRLHYTAPSDIEIGVVPIGTTDGLTSEHADTGLVLIRGRRCRIIGICSCEMMVDVSAVPEARSGDEVVVFGRQGSEEITAVDCATMGKTSYANLLTRIPPRVPRLYWRHGRCTGADLMGQEIRAKEVE
ncbi:MAG: alanine racemase [Bacillota bacterium]|nr:alanine racemase [Bacillota bacterium]